MKICCIISSLNGGGAARVLSLLCNYFSEHHQVSILTFDNEENFYQLNNAIDVKGLNLISESTNKIDGLLKNIKRIKQLENEIKNSNPDVTLSFMTETNVLVLRALNKVNTPVVISLRTDPEKEKLSHVWKLLRRKTYPHAKKIICQTQSAEKKINRISNNLKTQVIPNPVVLPEEKELNKKQTILFVGRFNEMKGFDLLPELLNELELSNWKVKIAGDGQLFDNVEQELKQGKNKEEIQLLGRVSNVASLYQEASIFVLPSRIEGFPNALIEAMSFGCACISFDCDSGPSEIISNNQNGILVEPENTEMLKISILELMNSPKRILKLGEAAKLSSKKYSLDVIGERWLNELKLCVE